MIFVIVNFFIAIIVSLLAAWIYLLPGKIALNKAYDKTGILMTVNFIFGITGIGWLATFIWALAAPRGV